jgi:menaquinol-cytochrome c reductase iron-sulfur subunit
VRTAKRRFNFRNEAKSLFDTQNSSLSGSPSRRSFYLGFIYAAWSAITAALAIPAGLYLFFPPANRKDSGWIDVAGLDSLPAGTPQEVSFQRERVDGWKVTSEKATAWIVKQDGNQVVAYSPQCTHLGCAYHWEEQTHTFVCPCHGSEFSIGGDVISGPAPRPLDRYPVKIEARRILIGPPDSNA